MFAALDAPGFEAASRAAPYSVLFAPDFLPHSSSSSSRASPSPLLDAAAVAAVAAPLAVPGLHTFDRQAQAFEYEMGRSYFTYPIEPLHEWDPAEARARHLADGEAVFGSMLETFLDGIKAGAPKP